LIICLLAGLVSCSYPTAQTRPLEQQSRIFVHLGRREQGKTPLGTSLSFDETAREEAIEQQIPLFWTLQIIPGVGHRNSEKHLMLPNRSIDLCFKISKY